MRSRVPNNTGQDRIAFYTYTFQELLGQDKAWISKKQHEGLVESK